MNIELNKSKNKASFITPIKPNKLVNVIKKGDGLKKMLKVGEKMYLKHKVAF